MCGIFGIVASGSSALDPARLEQAARLMFRLSEARGKDACGALTVLGDRIDVIKSRERVRKLLPRPEFAALLAHAERSYVAGEPYVVAGHTRMATNGTEEDAHNNQPISRGKHLVLHNGIIVNDAQLWLEEPALKREHQVDTEVFAALLEQAAEQGTTLASAVGRIFARIEGANTIASMRLDGDSIIVATSNGSLYVAALADRAVVFASEKHIAQRAAALLGSDPQSMSILEVLPGHAVTIDIGKASATEFLLSDAASATAPLQDAGERELSETHLPKDGRVGAPRISGRLSEIERLMAFQGNDFAAMRRCTRCVLPASFPSIRFDESGVCQFCRAHRPQQLKGEAALRGIAERARRGDGGKDCLVPISGGRDSCYGLHYVKNELGLNPVAYTYDWGFVTDLARRNISRMCGRLGVEHVLVAADIRTKRENVRKNVSAWLKRPELGMVPLFMAGDKMFFYYASAIKRQMGLGPILFSMNWLERTGFKTAYAGAETSSESDGDVSGKTYGLGLAGQARMIAFYARNFLTNPAYLNSSVFDTLFGYFAYYVRAKDYESIFDYLPWNEDLIVRTIIENYDWETSPDTQSTWRIGDGTAPFYNYIYLTLGGVSEHDTFRSNQIREGLISRESAMRLIETENRPRAESFKWYCDTIGIDAVEALRAINAMPKQYAQ